MAKKGKRRGNRDHLGRFLKASRNPKRASQKRRATGSKKTPKRAAPRRASTKRTSGPKKKKAQKKSKARRPTTRAKEKVMKKKPRKKARRTARETIVFEANPKPKKKPKKAKAASKKKTTKKKSGPKRGARRMTARVPAVTTRKTAKGGRRSIPSTLTINLRTGGSQAKKATKKKTSGHKKKASGHKKGKKGHKKGPKKMTAGAWKKHYEKAYGGGKMASENPLGFGGFALENPLSGGELALAFVTGTLGYVGADVVDRFLATHAKDATGLKGADALPNGTNTAGPPGIVRILAQAGLGAVPLIGAYFVENPMGRAALQGFGLGALFHLGGQLITQYVLVTMFKDNDLGKRLYEAEIAAKASVDAANKTGTQAGPPGLAGLPRNHPLGMGGRTFFDVGPRAGVGAAGEPAGTPRGGRPDGNPQYAPPTQTPAPSCMPCSAETAQATRNQAYQTATSENCAAACGEGQSLGAPPQNLGAPPPKKFFNPYAVAAE